MGIELTRERVIECLQSIDVVNRELDVPLQPVPDHATDAKKTYPPRPTDRDAIYFRLGTPKHSPAMRDYDNGGHVKQSYRWPLELVAYHGGQITTAVMQVVGTRLSATWAKVTLLLRHHGNHQATLTGWLLAREFGVERIDFSADRAVLFGAFEVVVREAAGAY